LKIARLCIENGVAIRDDGIYLNQIEIPTARVARAAGVDRRTVVETVRMIRSDGGLQAIFGRLQSAGLSLKAIAKQLGLGVVEITASDPTNVGILAGAPNLLADAGISVRQAIADEPELSPDAILTPIADTGAPGNLIAD